MKKYIFSICAILFCAIAFATGAFAPLAGLKVATIAAGGDFSCADLLSILGKSDQMWVDSAIQKDYMPKADIAKVILANQTAKLDPIYSTQYKDYVLKISWLDACEIEGDDIGNECDFDGPELSANCQEYRPTLGRQFSFKINENAMRASIYSVEEQVAKGMLQMLKQADEYLAQQTTLFIESSKGENVYAGIGTLVGSGIGGQDTKIAPSNWTASLMGYLYQVAEMNKIANPFLLSGSNLFQQLWNAQTNAANADGKGDLNKFQQMPINFDLFNVDSVNSGALKTYLLGKGALALGALNRYSTTPTVYSGKDSQTRYSVGSKTLPGVMYDVYYTTGCEGEGNMFHYFKLIVRGGVYSNPAGCTETNNSIISFLNAA